MQITREELNPRTIQLKVVCEPEEVKAGFDKALKQIAKKIRLPGFRPGHAPKAMIEQYVDKSELFETAAETIITSAFKSAVKQQELEPDPTVRPQVSLTKLDEENCEFTAKIGLPAVVNIGSLDGMTAERPTTSVRDEDVDTLIEDVRRKRSTRETVTDRGVQEGDVAVVNLKPDGAEGEGRTFMTIVGQTFPGLDQALLGMRVEDVKHLELNFPATFQEKDWSGQTMGVTLYLNSVSTVRLPELDDSFAQSLKTESVEELRTRVREGLENARLEASNNILADQLLDEVVQRSEVLVSDNMWEPIADQRLADMDADLKKQGKSLEEQVKENGMTLEELRENYRHNAKTEVLRAIVIREIFRNEEMKLTGEDLDAALMEMSREFGLEPAEMIDELKKANATNELQFRAIARKVREFLVSKAEIREVVGAGA